MDFMMALLRKARGKDSIMVIVDMFSKLAHFIAYKKVDDVVMFFDEVVELVMEDDFEKSNLSSNDGPRELNTAAYASKPRNVH